MRLLHMKEGKILQRTSQNCYQLLALNMNMKEGKILQHLNTATNC